jgi:hydroxyethylthiazole kinase-like sugar kinase family protein
VNKNKTWSYNVFMSPKEDDIPEKIVITCRQNQKVFKGVVGTGCRLLSTTVMVVVAGETFLCRQ